MIFSQKWLKNFYWCSGVLTVLALALCGVLFSWRVAPAALAASGLLILGFRVTELLIAVLTGVRKANSTAIALLMGLKLAWWAGLFILSRHISKEFLPSIAIGFGAFLLAVVGAGLWTVGLPKISPPQNESGS